MTYIFTLSSFQARIEDFNRCAGLILERILDSVLMLTFFDFLVKNRQSNAKEMATIHTALWLN